MLNILKIIEQPKFTYSPMGQAFEEQTETILTKPKIELHLKLKQDTILSF